MLALDGDPRWLVWLTLATALFGITAQVHQLREFAGARRVSEETKRVPRGKRRS